MFNIIERNNFFNFPQRIKETSEGLRTETNKVCFLTMVGYFKATKKFFPRKFHQNDIDFVVQTLGIIPEQIDINSYDRATFLRHKQIILNCFGFKEFDENTKESIVKEINSMIRSQLRPKLILLQTLEILKRKKIEVPSYNILANLIVNEMNRHRKELSKIIETYLNDECKQILNSLLEKEEIEKNLKVQRYKLTLLKKFNQSTKPIRIKENISDLKTLMELFKSLEKVIQYLDLTHDGIKYYANSVIKSRIFQVSRRADEDKYLHLIAFVVHQYFRLQDTLIDVFINCSQGILNSTHREHKEKYYQERQQRNQSINKFAICLDKNIHTLSQIKTIVNSLDLPDTKKVELIKSVLLEDESERDEVEEQLFQFKKESETAIKKADFYSILESNSIKLQNRVSDIVKHIEFNQDNSCQKLIEAIKYYRLKDGVIDKNSPKDFLDKDEQDMVFDGDGKFRISLYKALFFIKIADAIKAGTLNLKHSYKYRALDEYLISKTTWKHNKDEYLKRSDLEKFIDCKKTLGEMETILDNQYHQTNNNVLKKTNEFLTFYKNGSFKIKTPKVETIDSIPLLKIFPNQQYISLLEVLSTINKASNFLDCLEHWQVKYNRPKPSDSIFWAGIIGYGCNIGTKKISMISKQINESELDNTINWYFSVDNINDANDKILRLIDQLELPNIYRKDKNSLHTSSDGQKYNVAVESLNANYSFKYFGKDKGVSVYRFIDERDLFFHSNVISASEREAAYVIDGLMHNDVVKSDIHSTDTHGFSEIIFAVIYLLGFTFAPRIKNLKKQRLYSFIKRQVYAQKGYKILPDAYIQIKLIEENWDEILRFIATIKLKETTASRSLKGSIPIQSSTHCIEH